MVNVQNTSNRINDNNEKHKCIESSRNEGKGKISNFAKGDN